MAAMSASRISSYRRIGVAIALSTLLVAACGPGGKATGPASTGSHAPVATPSPIVPSASAPASDRPTPAATATVIPPSALGDRLVATIDGVSKPCAMAATEKDVWVTGNEPSKLARIDAAANTIVSQVTMAGSPCGIAVGSDGRLWIALLTVGQVVAVDPVSGAVTDTIDGFGVNLWDLKSGFGAIWLVDQSKRELVRIDPNRATVTGKVPVGPAGSGLAMAAGSVWVVDDVDGSVRRIDPATLAVQATIDLGHGASWFADDGAVLLVADRIRGSITPIDTKASVAGKPITGSTGPLDGTISAGRAYVPDGKAGTLIEIDLAAGSVATVDRLEGASEPFVAEVAFDDVWVLDYGGERIWRIKRSGG